MIIMLFKKRLLSPAAYSPKFNMVIYPATAG